MDLLSKRYGKLPHELLDLAPWELSLAHACADVGVTTRISRASDGLIVPVVVVE